MRSRHIPDETASRGRRWDSVYRRRTQGAPIAVLLSRRRPGRGQRLPATARFHRRAVAGPVRRDRQCPVSHRPIAHCVDFSRAKAGRDTMFARRRARLGGDVRRVGSVVPKVPAGVPRSEAVDLLAERLRRVASLRRSATGVPVVELPGTDHSSLIDPESPAWIRLLPLLDRISRVDEG
jgi:hypothetical protein